VGLVLCGHEDLGPEHVHDEGSQRSTRPSAQTPMQVVGPADESGKVSY